VRRYLAARAFRWCLSQRGFPGFALAVAPSMRSLEMPEFHG
jgi:hypothetical protein